MNSTNLCVAYPNGVDRCTHMATKELIDHLGRVVGRYCNEHSKDLERDYPDAKIRELPKE